MHNHHLFAVGVEGTILFFNGATWEPMEGGGLKTLTAVWGTAFNDVYASSFEGDIFHFDGVLWTSMFFDQDTNFWGLWGSSANDIIGIGDRGRILRLKK